MLKSSLCDYSDYRDAYILLKGAITAQNTTAAGQPANDNDIEVVFKTCVPLTDCINEINNTQIDNARDTDVVMSMYNLTEYSDNILKLWEVYDNLIKMNHI